MDKSTIQKILLVVVLLAGLLGLPFGAIFENYLLIYISLVLIFLTPIMSYKFYSSKKDQKFSRKFLFWWGGCGLLVVIISIIFLAAGAFPGLERGAAGLIVFVVVIAYVYHKHGTKNTINFAGFWLAVIGTVGFFVAILGILYFTGSPIYHERGLILPAVIGLVVSIGVIYYISKRE